jgi:hypothetical protein
MIKERKVKRPGLVRVSGPGDLDVRSIRLNAGSIGCTRKNFAAAMAFRSKLCGAAILEFFEEGSQRPLSSRGQWTSRRQRWLCEYRDEREVPMRTAKVG